MEGEYDNSVFNDSSSTKTLIYVDQPPPYYPPTSQYRHPLSNQSCYREGADHGQHGPITMQPAEDAAARRSVEALPVPRSYFCFSILNLLLCSWPLGLIALRKSRKVEACLAQNDVEGAAAFSQQALNWNVAALVVGSILNIILLMYFFGHH